MDTTESRIVSATTEQELIRIVLCVVDEEPLRRERRTRALGEEIGRIEGVRLAWMEDRKRSTDQAKALSSCEELLLALTIGRGVLPVVIKLLEAWVRARAEQVLVVQYNDSRVELRGARAQRDMELLHKLLER